MAFIYEITEENVDGCGSNAVEYVSSEVSLAAEDLFLLEGCLSDAKHKAAEDELDEDTEGMVKMALEKFEKKTGKKLLMATTPISGWLTF